MNKEIKVLNTPISKEDIENLFAGDIVFITGRIYTARDEAHIHALSAFRKNENIPVDFSRAVIYHCGPVMKDDGGWKVIAAGPTTSARMNSLEGEFIESFSISTVIGKGGMSEAVGRAMQKNKCVYMAITGGAAALAAQGIKNVPDVMWYEELGMAEAVWFMDVERFGPLIVAIDSHGGNLFRDIDKKVSDNLKSIIENLI